MGTTNANFYYEEYNYLSKSIFRSSQMSLCYFLIPRASGYYCMRELGDAGITQIIDQNTKQGPAERYHYHEILECYQTETNLAFLKGEILAANIKIKPPKQPVRSPLPNTLTKIHKDVKRLTREIKGGDETIESFKQNYIELCEHLMSLEQTEEFFRTTYIKLDGEVAYEFITGSLPTQKKYAFEKLLWRLGRGNDVYKFAAHPGPFDKFNISLAEKSFFIVFFHGTVVKQRIEKICQGFQINLHSCPLNLMERERLTAKIVIRIKEIKRILIGAELDRVDDLMTISGNIDEYIKLTHMMKLIYLQMDYLNYTLSHNFLYGEFWVPQADILNARLALRRGVRLSGESVEPHLETIETDLTPPTYHPLNDFTRGFQALVNAYGIPTYGEINPAIFTIITFPFLFAVMFGDIGHGIILTLFGMTMVVREKSMEESMTSSEIGAIIFGGRYIILLMGLFSVYAGFIYNDCFSKPFNIFGSSWRINYNESTIQENHMLQLDPASDDFLQNPYPLGSDPIWIAAGDANIPVINSLKMKTAIILGVTHMIVGTLLSVFNFLYFGEIAAIFLDFLPQIIFLVSIFFYLVLLMFLKWVLYGGNNTGEYSSACAPFILIKFINMVLLKAPGEPLEGCKNEMFEGQTLLERSLIAIAVGSIPVMLLGMPLYHMSRRKHPKHSGEVLRKRPANDEEEEESMGEIFLHQGIRTIECVLGCVSHTASYLRLWALSLAHGQLSHVLWNMVLIKAFSFSGMTGAIALYITFGIWATLTLAILIAMEGLSAFLHTLRLHWVEFQSKFYTGTGYAFEPFQIYDR